MRSWQLQDAKARLSEVVKSSEREGPQRITVRGKPAAVILSAPDFDRLRMKKPGFLKFIRSSPLRGIDLKLSRDRTPARPVKL
jgi:antitoxin Phd